MPKHRLLFSNKRTRQRPTVFINPIYNGFSHVGKVPAGTTVFFLPGQ